ncbi:MAG: glycosyltransferase family 4 protein [Bacteroidota bacterium]|nr:glycosyltransferase family 4 protein [Bacteroidota bacterium]MDX5426531.1 glycosyltransferase family 4 protein [Bacteroidota bacterium]MDX5449198.1 glycosyltransferase family 4 protein [Bacteroidota bacterium]
MKKRILFIAPNQSSFVRNDIKILSEKSELHISILDWDSKWKIPLNLLTQILTLAFLKWRFDLVFISFGGLWSALPTLFGKLYNVPVLIILNGTDVASLPSIPYGSLRKKIVRWACWISYKYATRLLPVSETLIKVHNEYNGIVDADQGLLHFFPDINTPYSVVHNGLDISFWTQENIGGVRNKNRITAVFSNHQFQLKGGDLILQVARDLPYAEFIILGSTPPPKTSLPENVVFLGKVSQERMRELFFSSSIHLQLSIFEGFGMSLCEAMLCGCIPVVSAVNMLPSIAGPEGFVLGKRDPIALKELLDKILDSEITQDQRTFNRQWISNHYSLEERKKNLNTIISGTHVSNHSR